MNDSILDKALKKATKEALENNMDSLDFYKDMTYIQTDMMTFQYKKKSRYRRLAIIASFFIILTLSSFFAVLISNGSVNAITFKIEQQITKLKNLFTSGDGNNYQADAGSDNIVLEVKSLDEIKRAQDFFPDLIVSNRIPNKFSFESLVVTKYSNGLYKANYIFKGINEALLTINQESMPHEGLSVSIIDTSDKINTDYGTIYFFEDPFGDGTNAATYLTESYIIDVNGLIEIYEIKDILEAVSE